MKKEEYDRATELLKKIEQWESLIDDINGDGVIEVGIRLPVGRAEKGRRQTMMTKWINEYIDDVTYRKICEMVKENVEEILTDFIAEFAEL